VSKTNTFSSTEIYTITKDAQKNTRPNLRHTNTGFSIKGIDLGSNNFRLLKPPSNFNYEGVNSYEAGEVCIY
jgi:hypothetical protein